MNPILFFDTETTGLPLFSEPSEHPDQPHIVQLAALLVDPASRKTIASMDVIVRPDGWTIPDEVAAVHGITTERAEAVGIPEKLAVEMFMALWYHRPRVDYVNNHPYCLHLWRPTAVQLPRPESWMVGCKELA